MAKNKKPTSGTSSYSKKKAIPTTSKKSSKKVTGQVNKKVEIISDKITKINKNFESLISECQLALRALTQQSIEA